MNFEDSDKGNDICPCFYVIVPSDKNPNLFTYMPIENRALSVKYLRETVHP